MLRLCFTNKIEDARRLVSRGSRRLKRSTLFGFDIKASLSTLCLSFAARSVVSLSLVCVTQAGWNNPTRAIQNVDLNHRTTRPPFVWGPILMPTPHLSANANAKANANANANANVCSSFNNNHHWQIGAVVRHGHGVTSRQTNSNNQARGQQWCHRIPHQWAMGLIRDQIMTTIWSNKTYTVNL